MTINDLVRESFEVALSKGFHDGTPFDRAGTLLRLCLVHSEVSECVQEVKKRGLANMEAIADELADVLIRVGDLAGTLDIDLDGAVVRKMAANRLRPMNYGTPQQGGN